MDQHPKVTLAWALNGLENAIHRLKAGAVEDRVRRQFHQFLLAMESDTFIASRRNERRRSQPAAGLQDE